MEFLLNATKSAFIQGTRLLRRSSSSLPLPNMACAGLTEASARQLLNDVDSFVFDCDGVLWDGLTAIEGSPETLKRLKNLGKRVYYITNNSSNSRKKYKQICEKLLGFPVNERLDLTNTSRKESVSSIPDNLALLREIVARNGRILTDDKWQDEVLCTAYAAALYLHNINYKGKVYVVGNPSMGEELDHFGINHTGIGPDPVGNATLLTDFANTELDPEVDCVLVGFDAHFNYLKMVKGASYARRDGALFLATNEDSFLPLRSEVTIPGTGSIVAAVQVPARRQPIVIGKPNPTIFNVLRDAHGLDPSRTLMVGDRCNTDIALAKNCGLKSLLVLSGVMRQEDIDGDQMSSDPEITKNLPDLVADNLWEFGKYIPDSL